jgi:hypothetical protein
MHCVTAGKMPTCKVMLLISFNLMVYLMPGFDVDHAPQMALLLK